MDVAWRTLKANNLNCSVMAVGFSSISINWNEMWKCEFLSCSNTVAEVVDRFQVCGEIAKAGGCSCCMNITVLRFIHAQQEQSLKITKEWLQYSFKILMVKVC